MDARICQTLLCHLHLIQKLKRLCIGLWKDPAIGQPMCVLSEPFKLRLNLLNLQESNGLNDVPLIAHRDFLEELGEIFADEGDVLVEAGKALGEESAELFDRPGELLKREESEVVHAVDRLAFLKIISLSRGVLLPGPAQEDQCKFNEILPIRHNQLSKKILLVLRHDSWLRHPP